ncbi:hypothetical protein [Teredinibacter turnerae]|uniref:hypothetical protein n=1 Tax=Teredinibacter turnerae TaxID=2426 RepID=UPI00037AF966|nr:hypothetical protein [Teredinibacter turnerae]
MRWFFLGLLGFIDICSATAFAAQLRNEEAVIPPQCYTKTEGQHNPCYICHQSHPKGTRLNTLDDGVLQAAYAFSEYGETNHWQNFFKDFSKHTAAVTDSAVLDYVRQDNYAALYSELTPASGQGAIALKDLGSPDKAFDDLGFANDGSGWVAFNYKPLPSSFWPTNGSADDVMIRLPMLFRQTEDGKSSRTLYLLNLSLVELSIKELPRISIPPTEEAEIGVDLDGDGALGRANSIVYRQYYLGAAAGIPLQRQMYPSGTEFLHTLRYLDVRDKEQVVAAKRVKEIRYTKKYKDLSEPAMRYMYNVEQREKEQGRLPNYAWAKPVEKAGLNNGMGWYVQSWLEDKEGRLRLANYEENFFCMGCHTTVGTTIDQSFSFPRKIDGAKGWGYIDLAGMPDVPNRNEVEGEYLTYFTRTGGGDEFRQNEEMLTRWFDDATQVDTDLVKSADVKTLITPSPERALALNKVYWQIVKTQSFSQGRDAVLGNKRNVFDHIDPATAPVLPVEKTYHYDLRLDWSSFLQ